MNNVELYQSSNQLQKRDVISFMNEYSTKIKWKKNHNRVLDIGCGDGGATNILKTYIPSDYTLLGCDVNEKMVKHANSCHGNDQVSFRVLDIQINLPKELKGSFDHVFSFFALHWVSNQERVFTNIYELLSRDGDCFTIFVAHAPNIDVYRILARDLKWKSWLHDLDRYTILPYSETQEPEKAIRDMMKKIGYNEIEVERRKLDFTFENMEIARNSLRSVCPFRIPDGMWNDFMDDYIEGTKEVEMFNVVKNGDTETLKTNYVLFVVHARK